MYGHASFHTFLQRTYRRTALQQSALSGAGFSLYTPSPRPARGGTYFCIPSGGNKEMTCCGVEMCVGNKAKQNRCQPSWHFYSGNSNLGWQNETNPPPPPPPGCLSAGSTTWLTVHTPPTPPHPPWHPDSQAWLLLPGQCHFWPAVYADIRQQQQMTRWEAGKTYSSLFCMENCQSV